MLFRPSLHRFYFFRIEIEITLIPSIVFFGYIDIIYNRCPIHITCVSILRTKPQIFDTAFLNLKPLLNSCAFAGEFCEYGLFMSYKDPLIIIEIASHRKEVSSPELFVSRLQQFRIRCPEMNKLKNVLQI